MLLNNFSNHIKNANWPAILIELLVVIVGVYGAFQLERWGEERRESRDEQVLLDQLHNEIELAVPMMEDQLKNYTDTLELAGTVGSLLMQPTGSGELSDDQCMLLFDISILALTPLTLTALDEMVSSGKHSQIDNRQLRTLLFTLKSKIKANEVYSQLVRPQQKILMDMYPELLPRSIDGNGEGTMRCDTDGMRTNQSFINHLMSNLGRYGGMSARLSRELEPLREVLSKLDEVLAGNGAGH
ncbi:MAG: hypothetical protein WBM54_13515 [Woeseia sp.]